MSDENATPTGTALVAPAPRPPKIYTPVDDPLFDILDTAKLEHMQRIASIMAQSTLVPDSLRCEIKGEGREREVVELPLAMATANCFLVVEQAVRWGMSPFAVAQCCSVVRGKLMYEGKLVHAVLEAKLKMSLRYDFFDEDCGEDMGVIVSGRLPGEDEERTVEGTVKDWRTPGEKSPWARPGNFKRQLRYRGAREWSRAHAPGPILGVVTDDDLDELIERRERAALAQSAVSPPYRITAGFPDEEERPRPTSLAAPTVTASAPAVQHEPDTSGSATTASQDSPDQAASGRTTSEPASKDGAIEDDGSRAEPGEQYVILGEAAGADGRFQTYKDGKGFSKVKGVENYPAYAGHPEPSDAEQEEEQHAAAGVDEEERQDAGKPTDSTSQPSSDASPNVGAPDEVDETENPFVVAMARLAEAQDWLAAKQAHKTLSKTDAYKEAPQANKDRVLGALWSRYEELAADPEAAPHFTQDLMLMGLWLNFGATSGQHIAEHWVAFYRGPYKTATKQDKEWINALMTSRKQALGG